MGFNNPLTGLNGSLIYPQVKSPDFSLAGQTGWAILKNGNAYFFNVTATGTITATSVVVAGATGGLFIYSGVPAHGNLIGSWAGASGTDAFGNAYPQGLNVTVGAISGSTITGSTLDGTDFILNDNGAFFYNGSPGIGTLALSVAALNTVDPFGNNVIRGFNTYYPSERPGVTVGYPGASGQQLNVLSDANIPAEMQMATGWNGSPGIPYIQAVIAGGATSAHLILDGTNPNNAWFSSPIQSILPGGSTPEVWHTAALTASFTNNGAADAPPRYRIEPVGSGSVVRLDGTVVVNVAAVPGATAMFTLPAGYRPATRKRFTGDTNFAGATVGMTLVQVAASGVVTCGPNGTTAQQLVLDGMTFPLD